MLEHWKFDSKRGEILEETAQDTGEETGGPTREEQYAEEDGRWS